MLRRKFFVRDLGEKQGKVVQNPSMTHGYIILRPKKKQ